MFRLAALYLMIVTAVGPAACCCTFTRLAGRLTDEPPAPRSACPSCSCCQHGQEESQPAAEAPERRSPPQAPDSPGCPCKQAAQEVVILHAAEEAQEVSLRLAAGESFCPALVHWTAPVPAAATPAFRESAASRPSVSTDDLLYACHILRC
jgi:hypothetical protein